MSVNDTSAARRDAGRQMRPAPPRVPQSHIEFEKRRAAERAEFEKRERQLSNRRKAKWLIAIVLLCLCCVMAYFISKFFASFFVVGEISIEGSSPYSNSEIISAAGIGKDDKLYRLDKKAAEKAITENLPYISSASISIKLPSYVHITVRSEKAVMYTEIAGEYYALSDTVRVLERADKPDRFAAAGILYVTLPKTGSAVVGMPLTLADGTDTAYIAKLEAAIADSELAGRVTKLFIDERFNTVLTVDGRYRVIFGSDADAPQKALAASRVIAECAYPPDVTAIIDVSDPSAVVTVKRDGLDLTSKNG